METEWNRWFNEILRFTFSIFLCFQISRHTSTNLSHKRHKCTIIDSGHATVWASRQSTPRWAFSGFPPGEAEPRKPLVGMGCWTSTCFQAMGKPWENQWKSRGQPCQRLEFTWSFASVGCPTWVTADNDDPATWQWMSNPTDSQAIQVVASLALANVTLFVH